MRHPVPKVMLLVASLASAAPMSKVIGNLRILPVETSGGPGALTISAIDGGQTGYYYDFAEHVGELRPKARTVVLLGLGGGEMLRAARRGLPRASLVGVDIDPEMVRVAFEEFHVGEFGVKGITADAFVYVKKLRMADVLLVDLFNGAEMPQPELEPRFWKDCRAALSPGGLLAVNVYPSSRLAEVRTLLDGAGLVRLEEKEAQGSTVIFAR